MKKVFSILATILMTASVFAQVPQKMSYQAVVRDGNSKLVSNKSVGMRFSILQGSPSGTPVYVETQTPTTDTNGLVRLEIGGGTVVSGNFSTIDWANGPYFIKTETDPTGGTNYTITGTSQLLSVPYALYASKAESVIGSSGGITSVIAGKGLTGKGIKGDTLNVAIPLELEGNLAGPESTIYAKNTGVGGDAIVGESNSGDGTLGFSNTGDGLYGQTETGRGVYAVNNNSWNEGYLASNDYGVYGINIAGGSGYIGSTDYGVYGKMGNSTFGYLGSDNYGAYGKHTTSGSYGYLGSDGYGVYGSVTGLLGIGVNGENSTFGNSGSLGSADYGVSGEYFLGANAGYNSGSLGTNSYGAYGFSPAQFGVWGESNSGQGVHGKSNKNDGVFGESTELEGVYGSSANSWGVAGYNTGSTNMGMLGGTINAIYGYTNNAEQTALLAVGNGGSGKAAYLQGSTTVTGTLYKGGGAFKIDHPLDPANKYLYHSFVESPDMMNVYNGNVSLDASGEATITLPDWFESLNKDFRYQLTCIGGFAPVYVAQEISGNSFKISGGTPGLKVSWQVTGIRHDKFADAHRIPLEEYKENKERGKYLHPIENGVPESYGINYEENQKIIREQIKRMEEIKKLTAGAEQNKIIRSEK